MATTSSLTEKSKFAVKNRAAGTAEENKAVMQGSIGVFGTYSVDEAKKAFTSNFESSTPSAWPAHSISSAPVSFLQDDFHHDSGPETKNPNQPNGLAFQRGDRAAKRVQNANFS